LPSLIEYLIVAYFAPSLLNLVILYPSLLNMIMPDFVKMVLPLEQTPLDYVQFAVALVVVVVSLILGYKIYRKNPDYWLNKIFTAFYVGIGLSAISFQLGLFTNPAGLILGTKFMFTFIMISLGLLLLVSIGLNFGEIQIIMISLGLLLLVSIGLNFGEIQILNPRVIIPLIGFVALPLIVLWLPGSITIQDVSTADIIFSGLLTVTLALILTVGLVVFSYFMVKVYRVSEGIVKKRIFFFLVGIVFTLILAGASTSLASILSIQFFDLLTPLIILVGISIIYYGFHISD